MPELRYGCDRASLPVALRERFVELEHDAAARAFMEEAASTPHSAGKTWLYGLLRKVMSDYDAYGLLDMYPMHLLSTAQLARLLGEKAKGRLLDIGAGNGGVTAHAAKLFQHVSATEASSVLRRKLRARGYEVLETDLTYSALPESVQKFDVVTCFNVLDRCSHPRTLLRHAVEAMAEGGRLVVSVPLPLRPHVHVGRHTVDQEEKLPESDGEWEAGVERLERELLGKSGVRVEAVSRVPYLCRGDAGTAVYELDAVVFVCVRA